MRNRQEKHARIFHKLFRLKFPQQPGFRISPKPISTSERNSLKFGRFFQRASGKVTQMNQLSGLRIGRRQSIQCGINGEQFVIPIG